MKRKQRPLSTVQLLCLCFRLCMLFVFLCGSSFSFKLLSVAQHLNENKLSRIVRKPDFCLGENKGADQLRGNREADQRLCFRYMDSTVALLPSSEI